MKTQHFTTLCNTCKHNASQLHVTHENITLHNFM